MKKKALLIFFIFFLGMNLNFIAYTMEVGASEKSTQKRKRRSFKKRKSKRRRKKDQIIDQAKQTSSESNKETKISDKLSLLKEDSYLKNVQKLAQEGLNGLPSELLLIIFEVDFNKFLNEDLYNDEEIDYIHSNNDSYLISEEWLWHNKSKCLLKDAIDHINKYCSINQNFRYAILGLVQRKYILALLRRFGQRRFFEIVRMPELCCKYFRNNFLSDAKDSLKKLDYFMEFIPRLHWQWTITEKPGKIKLNWSINGNRDIIQGDDSIHPTEGAAIYGFVVRIGCQPNDLRRFLRCAEVKSDRTSDVSGLIVTDYIKFLPNLEQVFSEDGFCLTPLMWAAFSGNDKIVEFLLENCDPNAICYPYKMCKKNQGRRHVSRYKNINVLSLAKTKRIMDLLINAGAEERIKCLKIFIKHAELDAIKYYLQKLVSQTEEIQRNAFLFSAKMGRNDVIEFFLLNYSKSDFLNQNLQAAIFFTAKYNHIQSLKTLLEYNKINEENRPTDKIMNQYADSYYDRNGNTALMFAAKNGDYEAAKLLLEYGVVENINELNHQGNHALMLACGSDELITSEEKFVEYEKVVRLLIKSGADCTMPKIENTENYKSKKIYTYPITQTDNPRLMTMFWLESMSKECGLSDKEIHKIFKEEIISKNTKV